MKTPQWAQAVQDVVQLAATVLTGNPTAGQVAYGLADAILPGEKTGVPSFPTVMGQPTTPQPVSSHTSIGASQALTAPSASSRVDNALCGFYYRRINAFFGSPTAILCKT